MAATGDKSPDAFRTIGELSAELGVAQHILRYWESKFPQLRPLQRAGNRRYYRPADVALARRIDQLLNRQGYTIRGAQQLIADGGPAPAEHSEPSSSPVPLQVAPATLPAEPSLDVDRLVSLRDRLREALAA